MGGSAVTDRFQPSAGLMMISCGRGVRSARVMKVGAPLSIAKSASTQLVRTDISRQYTRYFTVILGAPPVPIRQWFFFDLSTSSDRPSGPDAVTASTLRAYSRTRDEPRVQTGIISSTTGRRPVGTVAVIST